VDRVNQYPLYELGKLLRAVAAYTGEVPATTPFFDLFAASNALELLLKGKPFPISISRDAVSALLNSVQAIWNEHYLEKKADGTHGNFRFPQQDDPPILDWRWNSVRFALGNFETIFSTEMSQATTYFVPSRGIYSTTALIDTADQTFPTDIGGHIPDKARADWRSAGRCLAFSLLSATGFHVARAVEATLEVYYQLNTGKTGTLNGWHDYIQALEAVTGTPSPAAKTIAELKQMKDDYRNPVMHPRVTLTENDARMLFDNGESLIIAMAEEIKAIREAAGGTQGALALVGGTQAALSGP
jgi:hypothetical protein